MVGFASNLERSRGITVASRLRAATGIQVKEIRRVTPSDFQLQLEPPDGAPKIVVHVLPEGTEAETAWCAAIADGSVRQTWADLRWSDRIVIGGGS